MKRTIHCFVYGRVQGVWFRGSACDEARRLTIGGWAKNLADGSVEVMASGESEPLDIFQLWLQEGPDNARVMKVECEELPYQPFDEFIVA